MTEEQIQELERKHHAECIADASRNNLPISKSQIKRFAVQGMTLVQLYEVLKQRKDIDLSIDEWFQMLETYGIIKKVSAWQPCIRKYVRVIVPTQDSIDNRLFKTNRETLLTPKGVLEVMNLI